MPNAISIVFRFIFDNPGEHGNFFIVWNFDEGIIKMKHPWDSAKLLRLLEHSVRRLNCFIVQKEVVIFFNDVPLLMALFVIAKANRIHPRKPIAPV